MAINSQKLLSGSTFSTKDKKVSVNQSSKDKQMSLALRKNLIKIKIKLIKIDKLLKDNLNLQKSIQKINKSKNEKVRFKKQEERLEEKKEKQVLKNSFSTPQIGAFDRVNRFITYTFIGFLVNKFFKYYPQVLDFIKKIEPVVKFLESFVGNVFKGIVDFVDFGYKAYDQVRSFSKNIGGEDFQKTFDEFSSNLNKFINLAIVVGMATMGGKNFGRNNKNVNQRPGSPGGKQYRPNTRLQNYLNRDTRSKFIERRYGNNAARIYESRISQGGSRERALADVRKRYQPLSGPQRGLSGGTGQGSIFSRGFGKAASRASLKVLGKTGSRIARGVFSRVPIIGGLLDFAFSLAMGEPVGRAAAKAVGSTIGAALGTFIPIPFAGTILGGILGDIVGGALYDTLSSMGQKKNPVQGRANGGQITTRGGQTVGGRIGRTERVKREPPVSKPIKFGGSVGGEEKLKKIFPQPTKEQIGTTVDPFGFVSQTSQKFSSIPFLGPIFSIFGKVLLGDSPTGDDYRIAGSAFNIWINNAISSGLLKGGGNLAAAFAEGGMVDIQNEMKVNINRWAEKSIEELVKNKVTDAINDLRKNLGLKALQQSINGQTLPSEELGDATDAVGGARLLMAAGFPMLAAAILAGNIQAESGWRGQRTPWVLNDGAGTNKGLISWNRTRITNAERFLGKPLETASNAEQVKWIKEELRQYGLLDEFMDPNRTEEQLKSDAYKYIGWGIEGDRWAYSRQIFNALQKGEQGTYRPGGGGGLDSGTGGPMVRSERGTQLSGELGKFLKSSGVGSWGSGVWQHPWFGGSERRSYPSWHNVDRAIDIGGYWPSDQQKILAKVEEFNKKNNLRPVELLYGKPGTPESSSHQDHVHVAYEDGGVITKDKKTRNTSFLNSRAYYDDGDYESSTVYIQPVIETVYVPMPMNTVSFPGDVTSSSSVGNLLRS